MSKSVRYGLLMAGVFGAGAASAATDVSAITAAGTEVATVGLAVFGVYVGVKLWKWLRAAL